MKRLLTVIITATLAVPAFAAPKEKQAPAAAAPAAAAAEKAAAPAKAPAKAAKPLPMNARADEIDAATKTITQVNKDGKRVANVVTDKTEIKQGDAAAKFEDIKVGDTVAGLRTKTKPDGSEYEVVKITKFGAKAAPAEKKPAAEKKAAGKKAAAEAKPAAAEKPAADKKPAAE